MGLLQECLLIFLLLKIAKICTYQYCRYMHFFPQIVCCKDWGVRNASIMLRTRTLVAKGKQTFGLHPWKSPRLISLVIWRYDFSSDHFSVNFGRFAQNGHKPHLPLNVRPEVACATWPRVRTIRRGHINPHGMGCSPMWPLLFKGEL